MIGRALPTRFVRFLLVGVLNTAFGYGVYALLVLAGMRYPSALLVATVIGVLFNFKTTGRLVFGSSDNGRIVRFVAGYAGLYGMNLAGVAALQSLGASPLLAGALMMPVAAVVAYPVNKHLVFRK